MRPDRQQDEYVNAADKLRLMQQLQAGMPIQSSPNNQYPHAGSTPQTSFQNASGNTQPMNQYAAPSGFQQPGQSGSFGSDDLISKITPNYAGIGQQAGSSLLELLKGLQDTADTDRGNSFGDAINQMLSGVPGNINQGRAEDMANKEFDPQFQILALIAKQQQNRYNQAKAATSQGYGALGNEYAQSRTTNKAAADQQVQTANQNYGEAAKNLTGNFNNSVQDNSAFLAKMGILEGQGDLAANAQNQMAKELGTLTRQQQLDTGLASQLGTNQYQADTSGIANTKFAGQETQDAFLRQFMDQQSQNDIQKLGLTGQKQKATNDYLMQLQQGMAQGENNDWERAFKQAQLGLEQDKFALSAQNQKQPDMNPYDALQQRAMQLYGGDADAARQVTDSLLSAYQNDPNGSLADLLANLDPQMLQSNPQLQALAFDFFNRMVQQNQG